MVYIGIDISKYKHNCFICNSTGYGLNLKLFLEKNNYIFMKFNPLLIKEFKNF